MSRAIRTRARGHDHRRLRHRRPRGLRLRPPGVPAGRRSTSASPSRRRASSACWARTSWAPALDFDIQINRGAGAFVCGESTRADGLASRARRGEPRRASTSTPSSSGLWGKPTNLNNVETWANVPHHRHQRRRLVPQHRHRGSQGHQGLLPRRQGQEHRPRRGPHGHHAPRDHLRHRRRHPGRARSSRRSRPAARRAAASRPQLLDLPVDFDTLDRGGLDDGLRRHDRHGRGHLHGGRRQVLPRFPHRRVLRQVHPLPGRARLHATTS